MSLLFSPITIRDIIFKNRIVVSPMCQYSASDGFANDWHLVHLGSRAVGGAGLIFTEAIAVSPEGRISSHDLGLWKHEHIDGLKRITTFIEQQGSIPGIQLAHAGRKASLTRPWEGDKYISPELGGWKTIAPSPVSFSTNYDLPVEMTVADIKRIISDFKEATARAVIAGFKVLEIHGAHGYLVNEFLSPLCNKRSDEYGGDFHNRIRFLIELIQAVRSEWHNSLPLFLRISVSDWSADGWQVEDSIKLAEIVKNYGVDLIDCSSGGVSSDVKIPAKPGYQVPFSEAVKTTGILTGAVGIIVSADQAEEILQKSQADMVFIAREFLRDPYFPLHAAGQLGEEIKWPDQYERAKRKNK